MDFPDIAIIAFRDELEKISAVRTGRMPVSVANALRGRGPLMRGRGMESLLKAVPQPKTVLSAAAPAGRFGAKSIGAAAVAGAGLGIYGQHKAKKLYNDYQTGRAMRQASEGQGM